MTLPADRRWKLERMRSLLALFEHPEKSFIPVVIVGTKGKGSTGFFLQSILKSAGISAGFYSSPHLETPLERIRINGEIISKSLWAQWLSLIRCVLDGHKVRGVPLAGLLEQATYFEIMTLMAALAFKEKEVKIGIFEAGMGGRLDAVNALGASCVIVTPIDLDHQEFLGDTLAQIAVEKAAVIHPGASVITAVQKQEALRIIRTRVKKMQARLWRVTKPVRFSVGLRGEHQKWNAAVAVKAATILVSSLPDGKDSHVRNAVGVESFRSSPGDGKDSHVRNAVGVESFRSSRGGEEAMRLAVQSGLAATDWPGRFEIFPGNPSVILDGAHNPVSARALVQTLRALKFQGPEILIFGVAQDKDFRKILIQLSGYFREVVLAPLPRSGRGREVSSLLSESARLFSGVFPARTLREGMSLAQQCVGKRGRIVATGSFYLVGALRKMLLSRRKAHGK